MDIPHSRSVKIGWRCWRPTSDALVHRQRMPNGLDAYGVVLQNLNDDGG
jgi:hypothetical protein